MYEIFAILFREAIGSFCRGWLSFQVKWPECKGGGGQCVRVEGGANFDTAAVIQVFVAIGVNGACRVTAHLALRGAACRDTQSTLLLPPALSLARSSSFEPMLVSRGSCRPKIIRGSKKNGRSNRNIFFLFFRKWRESEFEEFEKYSLLVEEFFQLARDYTRFFLNDCDRYSLEHLIFVKKILLIISDIIVSVMVI